MKVRHLFLGAAIALALLFTACTEEELNNLAGNIKVSVTQADGTAADSLIFQSSLNDEVDSATIILGMESKILTSGGAKVDFPFVGAKLMGISEDTYPITFPISDTNFLFHLDWTELITNSENAYNLLVVAMSENAYYIGATGSIEVEEYPEMGELLKGSVRNVEAYYITSAEIEELRTLIATAADPTADGFADAVARLAPYATAGNYIDYFPKVTFNGTINSRKANISSVLTSLNNL